MGSNTSHYDDLPNYETLQRVEYCINDRGARNLISLVCSAHDPCKTNVRARLVHFDGTVNLYENSLTKEARDTFASHELELTIAYKRLTQCLSAPDELRTSAVVILAMIETIFCLSITSYTPKTLGCAALNLI